MSYEQELYYKNQELDAETAAAWERLFEADKAAIDAAIEVLTGTVERQGKQAVTDAVLNTIGGK